MQYTYIILSVLLGSAICLNNGVGLTPAMGWNSWNHFACNGLSEWVVQDTIDAFVKLGLRDKGYQYINLDDCWQKTRDPQTGKIQPDPDKFPSGIKDLADYAHKNKLKFGLYSDAGTKTCAGRPGSLNHEKTDAQTYADWGVDYLKYDNCYDTGTSPKVRYPPMRDALNNTGRHIFFSMCEWGVEDPWLWAQDVGNSWRTTGDIQDNWNSFITILDKNEKLYGYAKSGAWNDPDMLEVGNGGMSVNEYQAHFALWALMKAPLLIGCDLTKISKENLDILLNEEIIALNQDGEHQQGHKVKRDNVKDTEVWAGALMNKSIAVIMFNRSQKATDISFTFKEVNFGSRTALIRDLVHKIDIGKKMDSYTEEVPPHSVIVLKLTKESDVITESSFLQ